MIRQLTLSALILTATFTAPASIKVTVVEQGSTSPIEGATVISGRGMILGITDRSGTIEIDSEKDFPLEIRSVGFEAAHMKEFRDSVFLSLTACSLPELTVVADQRPIMKIVSYAREYCSGATATDTMQLYADYMFVNYLPVNDKKVKGYKRSDGALYPTSVRRYARFVNAEGLDSVARPDRHDNVSNLSFYHLLTGIPYNSFPETAAIKAGATTDSVMGKYFPYATYRKGNGNYTVTYDKLADQEDHRVSPTLFKVFGMTMDIDRLKSTFVYRADSDSIYSCEDFLYGSGALHALAKGKMFKWMLGKKDLYVDCYVELYPVEMEYLTLEEYKEDRKGKKEGSACPFKYPKDLQPLPASIQTIVDRVSELP